MVRAIDSIQGYAEDTGLSVQWHSLTVDTEFRECWTTYGRVSERAPTYIFKVGLR